MAMATVEAVEGSKSKEFPKGMRILLVDDCPCSLAITKLMLKGCNYDVTPCLHAREALTLIREHKGEFDLVITDVHMPEMDGFQLLHAIYPKMDIPVIVLSSDLRTEIIIKAIKDGACDYIVKPSSMEQYRNIWQHVYRKQLASRKKIYKRDNEETDSEETTSKKKARVKWTPELHHKFTLVVSYLGLEKAGPKRIKELMNDPNLTQKQISSHLQKFRKFIRKHGGQRAQQFSKQILGLGGWTAPQNNATIPQNPQFQNNPTGPQNPQFQNNLTIPQNPQFQNSPTLAQNQQFQKFPTIPRNPLFQNIPTIPRNSQFQNILTVPQKPQFQNIPTIPQNPQFQNILTMSQNSQFQNNPTVPQHPQFQNMQTVPQNPQFQNNPTIPQDPQLHSIPTKLQDPQFHYIPTVRQNPQFQNNPIIPQNPQFQLPVPTNPFNLLANTQLLPGQPQSSNFQVAFQPQEWAVNHQPIPNYPLEYNPSLMSQTENNPTPIIQNPNYMGQMQGGGFPNADMTQNYSLNGAYVSPAARSMARTENARKHNCVDQGTCVDDTTDRIESEDLGVDDLLLSILNCSSEDEDPGF